MRRDAADYVWDGMRGCWLLLTPEEWVRRHVMQWLERERGIPAVNLLQEYSVPLGGACQRADIVITASGGAPLMLVECKAADVPIEASVLEQAVRYNGVVGARYIMLTNGIKHYFYVTWNGCDYSRLDSLPDLDL